MTGIDYTLIAGMVATTAAGFYYQIKFYKLVDDLIDALSSDKEERK